MCEKRKPFGGAKPGKSHYRAAPGKSSSHLVSASETYLSVSSVVGTPSYVPEHCRSFLISLPSLGSTYFILLD